MARKAKKLTQTELARMVEITRIAYISNIETERCQPSRDLLEKICQALDLSYEEMLKIGNYKGKQEYSKLGVRIRQARKAKRLTQTKLAQSVGTKQGYIACIETERCQPSRDLLEKICQALDLSYEEMLEIGNYKLKKP